MQLFMHWFLNHNMSHLHQANINSVHKPQKQQSDRSVCCIVFNSHKYHTLTLLCDWKYWHYLCQCVCLH